MTTATLSNGQKPAAQFNVDVIWNDAEVKIVAGGKECKVINRLDDVCFDDEESAAIKRVNDVRKGRSWFQTVMTVPDMHLWMSIRKKCAEYKAEAPAAPAVPAVPAVSAPEPTPAPAAPAPNAAPAPFVPTALANHTATVNVPQVDGAGYTGGPTVRKKRQRKTDPTILDLYEDVNGFYRAVGLDDVERRISQLKRVKEFASGKIKRMTYDIPSVIRAEIIEPTRVLHCCGPMPTESECLMREETVDGAMFQRFLSLLNRYKKGTENAARLGTFLTYRISSIAYEDVNDLKETVSETLDALMIKAHTRLIEGIADADKALAEAMKEANTEKEQNAVNCAWANKCRALIRDAHEELNVAIRYAERFDMTGECEDRVLAFNAATLAARTALNAQAAAKRLKGVEV